MSGYTKLPGHYSESMLSPAYDEFFTNHCKPSEQYQKICKRPQL